MKKYFLASAVLLSGMAQAKQPQRLPIFPAHFLVQVAVQAPVAPMAPETRAALVYMYEMLAQCFARAVQEVAVAQMNTAPR